MKSFNRVFTVITLILLLIFIGANTAFSAVERNESGKPYRVEINRLCSELENNNIPDIASCQYITGITEYHNDRDFFSIESQYAIRNINGTLYRFDYVQQPNDANRLRVVLNLSIAVSAITLLAVMLFIRNQVIKPFTKLSNMTYALSKGNLTVPIKENKSRFFGRFIWGVNMLRETLEQQKQRELELQKEKQTLLLTISHDIKTPLSAIKLYAKALSKGLYKDIQKQNSIAESINEKADEIERFVSELSKTAKEEFLQLDVHNGDFYLSEIIGSISKYYTDKLILNKTSFHIDDMRDCIISGDVDRSIEVLQNIMENAMKYGDGKKIAIRFSDEENCRFVTIANSGCTLPESELVHIFDSFWRGSNSGHKAGCGLGLYICRKLMLKMNGDIYAEIKGDEMRVTAVFQKA